LSQIGVALAMPWYQHREGEYYLTSGPAQPEGKVLATVSLQDEGHRLAPEKGWRWEAVQPEDAWIIEDMDGWWGFELTLEEAQKTAEFYLRRSRCLIY